MTRIKIPSMTREYANVIRRELKNNPNLTDAEILLILDRLDKKPQNWRAQLAIVIARRELGINET